MEDMGEAWWMRLRRVDPEPRVGGGSTMLQMMLFMPPDPCLYAITATRKPQAEEQWKQLG